MMGEEKVGDRKWAYPKFNFEASDWATTNENKGYNWLTYDRYVNILQGYLGNCSLQSTLATNRQRDKVMDDEQISSCLDVPLGSEKPGD